MVCLQLCWLDNKKTLVIFLSSSLWQVTAFFLCRAEHMCAWFAIKQIHIEMPLKPAIKTQSCMLISQNPGSVNMHLRFRPAVLTRTYLSYWDVLHQGWKGSTFFLESPLIMRLSEIPSCWNWHSNIIVWMLSVRLCILTESCEWCVTFYN